MVVPTFVDLQGFVVGKTFIVKEVAILRNGTALSHYTFTSPIPWYLLTRSDKSKAFWLMANHHGLRWADGIINYSRAKSLITAAVVGNMYEKLENDAFRLIYVKGCEKRKWLTNLLDDNLKSNLIIKTLDADYEDCPSLDKLDADNILRCNNHIKHCALQNVLKIFNWWSQRQIKLYNV